MTINAPAIVVMAFYLAAAQERGFDFRKLRGTLQNDILKEFHAQNEFVFPPEPSVRLVCDVIEFCARHVPQWNPVSISGYHIREAGSTAAQELAFTLADGFHYVDQCLARGMAVDEFAPRLSFFFNAHNDLFEEVAKYRAARVLWADAMRNRYGATNEASWKLRCHAQTAGCSLQDKQPEVNLIRVAYQALAAVLGGCQSLHTNSMDETLALPSEHAVTLALRTQQVLAYETGVTNTADPLGGSYFIESLTRAMQAEALAIFDRIEATGGMIAAIEAGFFRREIADAAFAYQSDVDARRKLIVGVNAFVEPDEKPMEILTVDGQVERDQIAALRRPEAGAMPSSQALSGRDWPRGRHEPEPDGAVDRGRPCPGQRRRDHEHPGGSFRPVRAQNRVRTDPVCERPPHGQQRAVTYRSRQGRPRRPRSRHQGGCPRTARPGLSCDLRRAVAIARGRRAGRGRRRRRLAGPEPLERGTHDAGAAGPRPVTAGRADECRHSGRRNHSRRRLEKLLELGVARVFGPGTVLGEIAEFLRAAGMRPRTVPAPCSRRRSPDA